MSDNETVAVFAEAEQAAAVKGAKLVEADAVKKFKPHTAREYMTRKFAPQAWLVPGIVPAATPEEGSDEIPRGLVTDCIARAKCGKSWEVLALALAAVCSLDITGKPWRPEPKKVAAVFVNTELAPNVMRARLGVAMRQLGISETDERLENLVIIDQPNPADLRNEDGITPEFAALIKGVDLVCIDPLYKLILAEEDENKAADMAKVVAWRDSIRAMGCNVLITHHEAKRNGSTRERDITDAGSGSGVLSRDYDSRIVLDLPSDDSCFRKIRYSLRSGRARATDYCMMGAEGGIVYPKDENEAAVWEAGYNASPKGKKSAKDEPSHEENDQGLKLNLEWLADSVKNGIRAVPEGAKPPTNEEIRVWAERRWGRERGREMVAKFEDVREKKFRIGKEGRNYVVL